MKKMSNPIASIGESCSCAGAKLDRLLQPAILSILARERINGYKIGKRLESMAMFRSRKPDASGMYRQLKELERKGLVASVRTKGGKPDARAYAVTPCGLDCLKRWVQTLINYRRSMEDLLGHCQSALVPAKSKLNRRVGPSGRPRGKA
jgi:DNA-binding PadR family transcriptional regulator